MRHRIALIALFLVIPSLAGAQQTGKKDEDMQGMPGMGDMQMRGMNMGGPELMTMHPETFQQEIVRHSGSMCRIRPGAMR